MTTTATQIRHYGPRLGGLVVDYSQVTEFQPFEYTTEASTIGLRPGDWPVTLETTMGNGLSLLLWSQVFSPSGELSHVTYRQANGRVSLTVWND